jgi:hypothetical protein
MQRSIPFKTASFYFLGVLFISGFLVFLLGLPNLYVLKNRGIRIQATLEKYDLASNEGVLSYSHGGTVYKHPYWDRLNPEKSPPRTGQKMSVVVDPEQPAVFTLADNPAKVFQNNLSMFWLAVISMAAIASYQFYKREVLDRGD